MIQHLILKYGVKSKMMYIKIRGKPLWDARGTPCIGAPCIKLRDGPVVRVRGKPPFKECADTFVRRYKNVAIRGKPPLVFNTVISTKERSLLNEVVPDNMRFRIIRQLTDGMTARGKPPLIWCRCVLIRGKPVGWLHRKSRVYTAKNSVGFFGVFIPNRECFG